MVCTFDSSLGVVHSHFDQQGQQVFYLCYHLPVVHKREHISKFITDLHPRVRFGWPSKIQRLGEFINLHIFTSFCKPSLQWQVALELLKQILWPRYEPTCSFCNKAIDKKCLLLLIKFLRCFSAQDMLVILCKIELQFRKLSSLQAQFRNHIISKQTHE